MTSEQHRKSSFSTGRNRAASVNTPHFSVQAVHHGQLSTAERHTLPAPDLISPQNSADELGSNIPGSYPQDDMPWVSQMLKEHHDIDNPKHFGTMKVDLPLEEQPSGARQGVGSLPGPNAECGVAILPDERHPDRLQEEAEDSPLPSKEHPSGSRIGVGSLPGKSSEAGVATLPEERINGRPFGQGHTGFEKTLGNERTHVDIDTPATRTKGQHAQKETIFSATQREMKRDPDFLSHRGAFFQHPHQADLPSAEGVRTFVQGAAGAMYVGAEGLLHGAQGALQSFEERFKGQDPIQATKDMIQNLEARFGTEDTIKHAKEQIQHFEARLEAGAGDAVQGAKGMIHNFEARFAPVHNSTGAEEPSADITTRGFSAQQDSGDQKQTGQPASMFVPMVSDAADLRRASSRSPVPPTSTSQQDSQWTLGVPSTLPQSLQQEYMRSTELYPNEDGQDTVKYETSPLVDKGDMNLTAKMGASGNDNVEAMNNSNDREVPNIEGGDTARGVKGVQYYTQAQDGMLPGYPTPEGMATLINDRLKDDQARSSALTGNAEGNNILFFNPNITTSGRARFLHDDSPASAEAVRGSYSSEILPSSSDTPDPSIDNRIIEERREVPIFEGGSIHADGKYEAVFRPVSDYPEELVANSALYQAHQHHDLHRPGRPTETKDLSGQFTRLGHQKSKGEYATYEPKKADDRSPVLGQSTDVSSGKYDGAYHLASIPSVEVPSTEMPTVGMPSLTTRSLDPNAERFRHEQLVRTNHPNEVEERPDFRGRPADTAFGQYEATFHPAGVPARSFVAGDNELRSAQLVNTDDADKINKPSAEAGKPIDTAAKKHEAPHHLVAIPSATATQSRAEQADRLPSTHPAHSGSSQFGNQQLVKTNHPNEIDELPTFVNPESETAAGKYEATFHLAGMGPHQIPVSHSHRQPATTREHVALTSDPDKAQEMSVLVSGSQAAQGRHERIYTPVGAPLGPTQKTDIGRIPPVQLGQTPGVTKEMPLYLGKPLSGKQPVQEQHPPLKKTLN